MQMWCMYHDDPVPRAPQPEGISASVPALLALYLASDVAREVGPCRPLSDGLLHLPDGVSHCPPFYQSRVTVCSSTHG